MSQHAEQSYGLIAKGFHWLTALLVFGLLGAGFYMTGLDFSPFKFGLYGLHKSFGILVLVIAAFRFGWRFVSSPPPALETHLPIEKFLAKAAHVLLYGSLFVMPLSGWLMSSAGDFPNQFFGLFEMPDLVGKDEALFKLTRQVHEVSALVLLAVIGLHMAGAFKHHFIDRDATLQRMSLPRLGMVGGAGLVLVAGVLWVVPAGLAVPKFMKDVARVSEVSTAKPSLLQAESSHGAWQIDFAQSQIGFEVMQYGQPFEGLFGRFDGEIIFDLENLTGGRADIMIDIASIRTGSDDRDEQARSAEWFDVGQFPQARFVSESFHSMGANQYVARGDLSIRDVILPIDLPFFLDIVSDGAESQRAVMKADLTLNRLDFGVGQGQWESVETIGNAVVLSIHLEATRP